MKYKLHAVAHAERLASPSWKGTAVKLSSTFTFIGDLGPEMLARRYNMSLRRAFGPWVEQQDRLDANQDIGADFDMQPEAGGIADDDVDQGGDGIGVGGFDFAPEICDVAEHGTQADEDVSGNGEDEDDDFDPYELLDDLGVGKIPAYRIDLRRSMFIAGILHIIHNVT